MSVAKTIEIQSRSPESFEDAMEQGIAEAAETVDEMKQAWVMDQKLILDGDSISEYQVDLRVTFVVH